jgi:hypothetical protein
MFNNKTILIFLSAAILIMTGCSGSPVTTTMAKDEVTSVLLVGKLIGGTVEFDNGFRRTIAENDLQESPLYDQPLVRDTYYQKLDRVLFRVKPGELNLSFTSIDGKKTDRKIFVSPDITNEIRLD